MRPLKIIIPSDSLCNYIISHEAKAQNVSTPFTFTKLDTNLNGNIAVQCVCNFYLNILPDFQMFRSFVTK